MAATGAGGDSHARGPITSVGSKKGKEEESFQAMDDINLGEPSSSRSNKAAEDARIAAAHGHTGKASSFLALIFTQFARFDIEITILLLALLFICTVSAIFTRVSNTSFYI